MIIRIRHILPIFLLATLLSCDIFSTREPELPDGGTNIEWRFPYNPEMVVQNLEVAASRRSSNDYMRSFMAGDTLGAKFKFIADPDAEANNSELFDDWDLERERNHVQSLFAPTNLPLDSLIELVITTTYTTPAFGDSVELVAEYDFVVGHLMLSAPRQMKGQLEFWMRRNTDGGWYILRWRDLRIADSYCWSDLKAAF